MQDTSVLQDIPLTDDNPLPARAEQVLRDLGVAFSKEEDGTLRVAGDLDLSGKGLTRLPDLSRVIVEGDFYCSDNQLVTLAGAPRRVKGHFLCDNNQLVSLRGAPEEVGGAFFCHSNRLISLEGAPQTVGGGFICYGNRLVSLAHAPLSFGTLVSDFGQFSGAGEIPLNLRREPDNVALHWPRGFSL